MAMLVGTVKVGRTHPLYRNLLADATFHQLLLAWYGVETVEDCVIETRTGFARRRVEQQIDNAQ
jgi:hypothetical protein